MSYERKMIEAAKTRLKELSVNPDTINLSEESQAMGAMCAAADDAHITELVGEATAKVPGAVRKVLANMFYRWPAELGPLESALYDHIAEQLHAYQIKALVELKQRDDGRHEAALRDRQERTKDLQEEDDQFKQGDHSI